MEQYRTFLELLSSECKICVDGHIYICIESDMSFLALQYEAVPAERG